MLGIILSLYIGTILLLNIPYVQRQISVLVANELANVLGTELTIGRINMGLLNRIIIDDLLLNDQSDKEMLKISRLSAKFDILPLFKGKDFYQQRAVIWFQHQSGKENTGRYT